MLKNIKQKIYILLRKSEKYTQTDMVYLARGGFWLTSGQIISSCLAFLLSVAFANWLPKETYGIYKYMLSIAGILAITALSGMGISLARAVARGFEGSLIPVLKIKIRWGAIGATAGIIISAYYYFQGNSTLFYSFLIISIFAPFINSFGIYGSYLNGKKLFDISTKYRVATQFMATIILIIAVYLTDNLFYIIISYFASYTLLNALFYKITIKKFNPNKNEDGSTISFGKHLSLMGAVSLAAENLDKILIWHFLGAAPVAVYYFATAPVEQIKSIIKKIKTLSLPKLSRAETGILKKTLPKKVFKIIILILFIVIVYILSAPLIYKILFPKYLDAVFYSQIFALSMLLTPQILFKTALEAKAKQRELYFINLFAPAARIALFLILLPLYGIMGMIASIIIARTINFAVVYSLFKKM